MRELAVNVKDRVAMVTHRLYANIVTLCVADRILRNVHWLL